VVLTSFLIFKGSPESRDGQDEVMDSLRRIELRLEQIEGESSGSDDHPHPATGATTHPK
jgi:hypothetical protein